MINSANEKRSGVYALAEIIRALRGEGGCPWDREQTHASIRRNLLEEAYEAAEAIDTGDAEHLREELGDVLMQVVFHADIEASAGRFDLDGVAEGACRKLVSRHPHIFGDVEVRSSAEVLSNWDEIKKRERGQAAQSDAMDGVARSLPALWRAEKLQAKAAKVGFDWPEIGGAMDKLSEEFSELKQAVSGQGDAAEELGDLLFSAVNVARFLKLDPEAALSAACDKFIARFRKVEELAEAEGKRLDEMTLSELDRLWDAVKNA